ncbi:hypothetical protein NPIL_568781 [Nephila pilipes]|uniref:Uncharacterized protein n=1 Tax=Nephila pilipes TaxID=299642 RepID=A0A8X6QUG8_NEPPI|nr:hypothetical protein NPIL_568781 [Nephila pilipes]
MNRALAPPFSPNAKTLHHKNMLLNWNPLVPMFSKVRSGLQGLEIFSTGWVLDQHDSPLGPQVPSLKLSINAFNHYVEENETNVIILNPGM